MAHTLELIRGKQGRWRWIFKLRSGDLATGYIIVEKSTDEAERALVYKRLRALTRGLASACAETDETDDSDIEASRPVRSSVS